MAVGVLPRTADKAAVVEAMFDRIAPRYDLLNRVCTFRLDRAWRRKAVELAGIGSDDVVIDLGCGTGDMCELAALAGARVIGVDFAAGMLAEAQRRQVPASLIRADVGGIPVRTGAATVVTSAFVLRNLVSIPHTLAEAARVLAPGGRLTLLEVDRPAGTLLRCGHALYFRTVVPLIGSLLSERAAYTYLPRSAVYLPPEPELLRLVAAAGFASITKRTLGAGAVQVIAAVRR